MGGDAARIRAWLEDVEASAQKQRWDDERPWRADSHVWEEGGLPVVDLHDLGAAIARRAAEVVAARADEIEAGAVLFIVGKGKHSKGKAVLGEVVREVLAARCRADGWRWAPAAAGRLALIVDERRAPPAATGRLGLGLWLLIFTLLSLAVWACLGLPGVR